MDNTALDLNRLTYDLEESPVTVIALEDWKDLRFDGINVRLIKDMESEVPLWVAEILEEAGLVIIRVDEIVSHGYMNQLSHQEGEKRTLTELDSLLYRRVRNELNRLNLDTTPQSFKKLTSIEGSFHKVLRLRFRKILNLVIIDDINQEKLPLTREEQWLYSQLHQVYSTWKDLVGKNID